MSDMSDKPTVSQVCWVLQRLSEHMEEGGTFRFMVHDRFGFDAEAYYDLMDAGGMEISNVLDWMSTMDEIAIMKPKNRFEIEYSEELDRDPEDPN